MKSYVEHANMSVVDAQKTIHFLTSAIPEWRVRGGGKLDNWFGRAIEWFHVGDEQSYIAISTGGEGGCSELDNGFHWGKAYWYCGTQCGCGGRATRVGGLRVRSLGERSSASQECLLSRRSWFPVRIC